MKETKDQLFQNIDSASDFEFNQDVANVFDDMIQRSIPFYKDLQSMIQKMALDFSKEGSLIYDLGSATGESIFQLAQCMPYPVQLIGIDHSQDMIKKARSKCAGLSANVHIEFESTDLNVPYDFKPCDIVLMILTLQFVRPVFRPPLINRIYQALNPNGAIILLEKISGETPLSNRYYIDLYHQYKEENGYSKMEISAKG